MLKNKHIKSQPSKPKLKTKEKPLLSRYNSSAPKISRKIQKSGSSDTLVESRLPSKPFLEILNTNAIIIQKWYRKHHKAKTIVEIKVENHEDPVALRRREKAERAKQVGLINQEILAELQLQTNQSKIVVTDTQDSRNIITVDKNLATDIHLRSIVNPAKENPAFQEEYNYNYEEDFESFDAPDEVLSVKDTHLESNSEPAADITTSSPIDDVNVYSQEELDTILQHMKELDEEFDTENQCSIENAQEKEFSKETPFPILNSQNESLEVQPSQSAAVPKVEVDQSSSEKHEILELQSESMAMTPKPLIQPNIDDFHVTAIEVAQATPKSKPKSIVESPAKYVVEYPPCGTPAAKGRGLQTSPAKGIERPISCKSKSNEKLEANRQSDVFLAVPETISRNATDETSKSVSRIFDLLKSVQETPKYVSQQSKLDKMTAASSESNNNVFEGIKSKIMQQQLEIESKTKTIEIMREELKRQKEIAKAELQEHRESLKSQLNLQRKEYETIVKRHLGFIDKVMVEKEELTKKSLELTDQVKNLDKVYQEKIKSLESGQTRELKQQREMWQAAEKIKRDKWISEKTKMIKDSTVQGLEPEIQKLIAQHKLQLRQVEESSRETLSKEKENLFEQHQRQLERLRDKHISEAQKACEEEREFARQRYVKQLERDEMEFQQHKRKMQSEFDEEKHRLLESANDRLASTEKNHKRAIESMRKELDAERVKHDEIIDDARKKHLQELIACRQQLQIEKEEWQANYMKKTEAQNRTREKEFREQLIQQRDQEIEIIIQRLESETGSNTSDATRKYRMDVERIKGEAAEEIKQLRDQHSLALDKLLVAQAKLSDLETKQRDSQKEILQLQHSMISKDTLVRKQKEELGRLKVDESELIAQISTNC